MAHLVGVVFYSLILLFVGLSTVSAWERGVRNEAGAMTVLCLTMAVVDLGILRRERWAAGCAIGLLAFTTLGFVWVASEMHEPLILFGAGIAGTAAVCLYVARVPIAKTIAE